MQDLKQTYEELGLSSEAANLVMDSWRPSTVKAYDTYIRKWQNYTTVNKILEPTYVHVVNFLAELYKDGASHSTINLARSAVSAYISKSGSTSIGSQTLVCRFVKGVFENRPSLPKAVEIWDVDDVAEHMRDWGEVENLTLKRLTLRLVMLLALLTGQRCQTLHAVCIEDFKFSKDGTSCTLVYNAVLKQTTPKNHIKPLVLTSFPDKRLCVITHVKEYLKQTEKLRQGNELFIALTKPHNHVSKNTIARWIKDTLQQAGIDIQHFSAHSTRAASTSAAFERDVPVESIMKVAGWTRQKTFSKYYCKPVANQKTVSQSVLDKFLDKS